MSDKRRQLLNAAEQLFADRGYGNTQVSEIARVAGTGISTFYRYFQDKQALLATLVTELFDPLRATLRARRAGIEALEPVEIGLRIRDTFALAFDALLLRPHLTQIVFTSGYGSSPAVTAHVQASLDRIATDLVADLERANATGLIHVPEPNGLARAIVGVILHLAHANITAGSPSRDAAIDVSTRMTLGGLMTFADPQVRGAMIPLLELLEAPIPAPHNPEATR